MANTIQKHEKQLYGWLVVNGFLQSEKFSELYEFFHKSAKKLNIRLQTVPTDALIAEAIDNFSAWEKPDFVLFWDKDTVLATRLEKAGFRLFNNARAIEICDSKVLLAVQLANVVPMPQTLFSPKTFSNVGYTNLRFVQRATEILGLPLVIKEAYGSFGQQVYLAQTLEEAVETIQKLQGKDFVLQRFVSESFGRDVRINVVGGKFVNAILRQSQTDFRSNITLGGSMCSYQPTPQEISVAEKACQALGLDFAGVDVMFGKDGPLVCEVNSNPHFKTTYMCTSVDMSELILQHIKTVLN